MADTSPNVRQGHWTPETITRLWEQTTANPHHHKLFFTRRYGGAILSLARRSGLGGGEVLDYGCGVGYLTQRLVDAGFSTTALDFSRRAVRETESRVGAKQSFRGAVHAETTPTPLRSGAYDFIFSTETYEHLLPEWIVPYFGELHRLLRPGGLLLLSTPDREHLQENEVFCPFCNTLYHRWGHLRSADAESLAATLSRFGFEVRFARAFDLDRTPEKRPRLALSTLSYDLARRAVGYWWRRWRNARDKRPFPSHWAFAGLPAGPHLIAVAAKPAAASTDRAEP